jgi:hypothetical protein
MTPSGQLAAEAQYSMKLEWVQERKAATSGGETPSGELTVAANVCNNEPADINARRHTRDAARRAGNRPPDHGT